jgi:hypothetical protein
VIQVQKFKMNFRIPIAVYLLSLMANGCSLKHHHSHAKLANSDSPNIKAVGDQLKQGFAQTGGD